jgi:hypothetical protein
VFASPKSRRLHLIDTHAYPKEYFFAVTNRGISGLLKKWGEGASMLRGVWKERNDETEDQMDAEDDIPTEEGDTDTTHARSPQPQHKPTPQTMQTTDEQLDGLTSSMTSLSLVPPSIRFGRGGKSGGFGNANANANGQTEAQSQNQNQNQSGDPQRTGANAVLGRGRGRCRGRGFIYAPANGNHIIPAAAVSRGRFPTRGLPVARGGIIDVPSRARGKAVPRGRGRGGLSPI